MSTMAEQIAVATSGNELSSLLASDKFGFISVKSYGAVGDGATDDTTAINNAISAAITNGGGIVFFPAGTYLISSVIEDGGKNIIFQGVGASESDTSTTIQTTGAITAVKISGNRTAIRDMLIKGDSGAFNADSHGIWVRSSRACIENVIVWKHRGNGIHYTLGNASFFKHVSCLQNSGHGFFIGRQSEATLDDNASTFINIDTRANMKSGLYMEASESFANNFYNVVSQGNTEYGVYINCDYNHFYGLYVEGNTMQDIYFDTTADYNWIFGVFSNTTPPYHTDNSTSQRNYIQQLKQNVENLEALQLDIGAKTSGLAGYLRLQDNGTRYALSLEGTSSSLVLDITSSGAGILSINPDAIEIDDVTNITGGVGYENSWQDYGGSRQVGGYWKDKFGVVHVRGVVSSGTTTNPTVIFTLPTGYRPTKRTKFATVSAGAFASFFIDSDGNFYFESGSNTEYSIECSFRTD